MVKNEKGFTLVELLAAVVIFGIILVPLMYSLVSNVTTNANLHVRRSSVSLAEGTVYGFDKLSFSDLQDRLGNDADNYLEYNSSNCATDLTDTNDQNMCSLIFGAEFNNNTFDDAHFRVFIYEYNIDNADYGPLTTNTSIPQEVRDHLLTLTPSDATDPELLRITVWINYLDDPYSTTIVSGLLIGDWTDSVYE